MGTFSGTLGSNAVYASLFNMIISQEVFSDNISKKASALVDLCKQSVDLYGDRALYYDTDVLPVHDWAGDAEAAKLLDIDRPTDPVVQEIVVDTFKQIRVTLDNYLSKQAWMGANAFATFNTVVLGWLSDTKRVYDMATLYTKIGTDETSTGNQKVTVSVGAEPEAIVITDTDAKTHTFSEVQQTEIEAYNRMRAQKIASAIEDIFDDLEDFSRDHNDNGTMKSFSRDDMIIVWNCDQANKIRFNDLPTIYNADSAKPYKFDTSYKLPSRFFGTLNSVGGTSTGTVRAALSKEYPLHSDNTKKKFFFAGDIIENGYDYLANEAYTVNGDIVCKIMHKRSMPYMSAFEVGTDFFNSRSLTTNNYLTMGFNTLEHLKNYPFITVYVSAT